MEELRVNEQAAQATSMPLGYLGRSQGRTLGEGECAILTSLTWTITDLHSNNEEMQQSQFGERVLAGPVLLAVASGLCAVAPWYRDLRGTNRLTAVAALSQSARYSKPFYFGDTIFVETDLTNARNTTSNPSRAILTFNDRVINQREEIVMYMERTLMFQQG